MLPYVLYGLNILAQYPFAASESQNMELRCPPLHSRARDSFLNTGVDPLYDSAADGQGAMYQDVAPEDPYADDAQINGGDPLYEEGVNYNTGGDPLYSDTPNAYTGGEALYDEAAECVLYHVACPVHSLVLLCLAQTPPSGVNGAAAREP